MKKIYIPIIMAISMFFLGHSVMAEPVTLKFAVVDPAQSPPVEKGYKPWARMIEEAAEGTLKIEVYPGGTLGRDSRVQLKLVTDGVADMAYIIPAATQGRI